MKFDTPVEELHHWLGMLELDLRLGINRRHLLATARLCTLLVEKLKRATKIDRYTFNTLSLRLLDLQRSIASSAPAEPNPQAYRAGKFRVITGGRTQTGSPRR